jgi:hypothetical protein
MWSLTSKKPGTLVFIAALERERLWAADDARPLGEGMGSLAQPQQWRWVSQGVYDPICRGGLCRSGLGCGVDWKAEDRGHSPAPSPGLFGGLGPVSGSELGPEDPKVVFSASQLAGPRCHGNK